MMSSKAAVNRATRLARLSARIFGEVVRKTSKQSPDPFSLEIEGLAHETTTHCVYFANLDQKVVQMFSRFPWQRELPSWYPPFSEYNSLLLRLRHVGLYRDEHLDFKEKMDAQRRARRKGPPKKGEGKRSKSKK